MRSMGTFGILFLLVYPSSPQIFSSVGIFVIRNVYFDRTILFRHTHLKLISPADESFYNNNNNNDNCKISKLLLFVHN